MRVNTIVTLGASAAFGVLAIFLSRGWINDAVSSQYTDQTARHVQMPQNSERVRTVPVLVADVPVNFGDQLSTQNIRIVQFPQDAVPEGSYSAYNQLFKDPNGSIVALTRISMNEPILGYKVSGPDGRGGLSAVISENMRAVGVRVNDVAGVGGFVLPGDYVDVVLTRDPDSQRNGTNLTASLLLENVRVLGTDQNADDQSVTADVVKTVTLEVTPQQAQKLILGMDVGKLSLTLRRAGEINSMPTRNVKASDLGSSSVARVQMRTPRRRAAIATAPKPTPNHTAKVTITRDGTSENVSVFKETLNPDEELAGGDL